MKKLLFILTFFSIIALKAQPPVLESYISMGLESNLALKQQNLELQKSLKSIEIAKANFLPKISFAPTYSLAAGGRSLDFPIGDLLNPVYSTLNQLTKSTKFPQVENVNVQLAPNNFHDTKFSIQYPIFNTDIKYNLLIQKELLQTEEAKKKVLVFELRHNITTAYYQYLQIIEGIKIIEQSQQILQQFIKFNQKLVNNQVATKDVVLSAEYELSKLNQQLVVMEKNRESAKAYFNFLLNRDLNTAIQVDDAFAKQIPSFESLENYKESSLLNRPEFGQLQSGIMVSQSAIKMQEQNAKLPSVFVGANTGFQGYGYTFKNQAYIIGQVGLQWDLYHGNEKKHKIEQAKIQKTILETKIDEAKQQVQLQVTQAYYDALAANESLTTAQSGTQKTNVLLQLIDSRYRNGNALYIEYLKAQNDDLVARLAESLAKYDIWVKKSVLDKVSGR